MKLNVEYKVNNQHNRIGEHLYLAIHTFVVPTIFHIRDQQKLIRVKEEFTKFPAVRRTQGINNNRNFAKIIFIK